MSVPPLLVDLTTVSALTTHNQSYVGDNDAEKMVVDKTAPIAVNSSMRPGSLSC
jgi:hypothetical protein